MSLYHEAELIPLNNLRENNFDVENLVQNEQWMRVWAQLDQYGRGRITNKELEYRLLHTKMGNSLPDESITRLLQEADLNKDGYISKQEFLLMIQRTKQRPMLQRMIRQTAFLTIPRSGRSAKVRDYIDQFSCWPPPFFMILISIVEIGIFTADALQMEETVGPKGPVNFESPLIYNPYKRCQAWRFLTYMFVHSGYLHLIFNLILQLVLGVTLELVHHWWRVMIVYTVGVIGGGLAASLTNPGYYLAGASGGVYALEFAYLGNLILNWSEMRFAIVQAVGFALITSLDVGFAVWDTYFSSQPSNTSYMAHLGGAVTGVLIGVNVLRNLEQLQWEKYCWWISLVFLLSAFVAAVLVQIFASEYFPPSDPVCPSLF